MDAGLMIRALAPALAHGDERARCVRFLDFGEAIVAST